MEKLVYILDRRPEMAREDFNAALLDAVTPRLKSAGACAITVNVADLDDRMDTPETKSPRIYGDWHKVAAVVHFWLDSIDHRQPLEAALATISRQIDGYLVTESIVQACERTWSGKQRRPGVTQMALVQKPPAVSDAHFYHHWQVIHSPWSFELHPLRQSYVRNATARALTPDAPPWRGIVLEHWRELEHFTDERLYYASTGHVEALWADVAECVDLPTYTGGPMSEYHFD